MFKHKVYTLWVIMLGGITFLVTYPLILLVLPFKKWHGIGHKINKANIQFVLFFAGIRIKKIFYYTPKKDEKYIFCSNHASYMDIPTFYLLGNFYFRFVGKSSLEKIPLFGLMYRNLYISFDRRDPVSRQKVIERCKNSLKEGISVAIYPEGAIPPNAPELITFKDGAFKLSVEEKVPIVPITLPHNFQVLHPNKMLFMARKITIIVHEPLNTPENPIHDYRLLRDQTYNIIKENLTLYNIEKN